jgi:redox-sensitive bicupin YhaK (pirin superfamily)
MAEAVEPARLRAVARIDKPVFARGHADNHRVRPLIQPGDWAFTDPFLLLMEDEYGPGVFSPHPHRGIETLTYLIEGQLEHYDNHGVQAIIEPGDALLLTAGRGLVHDERPATGGKLHIFQLWINLPRADKLVPARVQVLRSADLPVIDNPGIDARLFSGTSGAAVANTVNHVPFTFIEIQLEPGAVFDQPLAPDLNGFVVVLAGAVSVGIDVIGAGQIAWLGQSVGKSLVRITALTSTARVFLAAGQPLREPVAARGPFVMNTQAELDAAYAEFRANQTAFGK